MAKKVKVVSCPLTADDATAVINAAIDGLQAEEEAAAVAAVAATTMVSAAISEVDVKDMQGERALIVYTSTLTTTNVAVTRFTGSPDATIVVYDSDNKVVKPQADGTYKLAAGDYTYTITRTGYDTQTDYSITVSAADVSTGTKTVYL